VLKYIYRAIILIAVFVASLYYFSGDIKEVVFDVDNTTMMAEATFPLVTIKTDENSINLLHGYSTNLAANMLRESVTPLNLENTFQVVIDQEKYDIKKLNYEVREFAENSLIETDSISVFEDNDNQMTAKIKIKADLEPEKEYAVKITLITSESKKMYYYQRIKIYEDAHLKEKLDFILAFHNSIMDKKTAEDIIKYLEPANSNENSTLSNVNINSSFDLVSWGNLKPVVLTEITPTVKEIYEDTASVELSYIVEAEVAEGKEQYRVAEFYRVRYSTDRMFLLNYERSMEALFDINLASTKKGELKLGITSDYEVPSITSTDKTKVAFVRNKELWFYNLEDNEITKVFSFRQENTDYIRDLYDQHDISILNMDAEGNLDFLVYGYMNRGQYEGRVAIILYRFIRAENRIEERVYIPVEESYQTLKENISERSYVNSMDVCYFYIYNNLYSYNLTTRKLSVVAGNVDKDHVVFLKDINYAAWQENSDPKLSKKIYIMDMESDDIKTITADDGYSVRLMDVIDSNLIYGYVKVDDITSMMDGSILAPLSSVEIASVDKQVLKSYKKSGYYISGLEVKENIVELHRVQKVEEDNRTAYVFASEDYIMNQEKSKAQQLKVTSRVTEQALTEYYLTLPEGFVMNSIPKVNTTVSTVISQDPTVRLPKSEQEQLYYYPYIMGGVEGAYENAADAIKVAKERIGVVLNNKHQVVWERGVKTAANTITKLENASWEPSSNNTVESCLKLLFSYQGVEESMAQLNTDSTSAYDVLKKYSEKTTIRLTGITLDDALYYVSKGIPVIAMTDISNAVIIYGYDTFNIMLIDPSKNRTVKMGIQDGAQMFEDAGSVFLSYLGE